MAEFILFICSRVYLLLLCRLFARIYFKLTFRLFSVESTRLTNCKVSEFSFLKMLLLLINVLNVYF